jgi:hypothetical protein
VQAAWLRLWDLLALLSHPPSSHPMRIVNVKRYVCMYANIIVDSFLSLYTLSWTSLSRTF